MYINVNGLDATDVIVDASVFYSVYFRPEINPIRKDQPYSIRGITHDGKERYIAFFTSMENAKCALEDIYDAIYNGWNAVSVYER